MRFLIVMTIAMAALVGRAAEPAARGIIDEGAREVLAALRDAKLSKAEKGGRVAAVAGERIDFEVMGRLSMGPSWKEMTEAQRVEFLSLFRTHVLAICSAATEDYTNEDAVVGEERVESNGDRTIPAQITGTKNGAPRNVARVEFRTRRKADGAWGVIDVTIEGISLAGGFRTQFQSVIKAGGIEHLLDLLRKKTAKGER